MSDIQPGPEPLLQSFCMTICNQTPFALFFQLERTPVLALDTKRPRYKFVTMPSRTAPFNPHNYECAVSPNSQNEKCLHWSEIVQVSCYSVNEQGSYLLLNREIVQCRTLEVTYISSHKEFTFSFDPSGIIAPNSPSIRSP